MKILIDMNLSPMWVDVLQNEGWDTHHWSSVGNIKAPDSEIMEWARQKGYCVFTHDLDFSAILATTKASAPSVFQIRTQDILPKSMATVVIKAFKQFQPELENGAIVSVNEAKMKVRVLPI